MYLVIFAVIVLTHTMTSFVYLKYPTVIKQEGGLMKGLVHIQLNALRYICPGSTSDKCTLQETVQQSIIACVQKPTP